jgi:hypothetical protein
MDCFTLRVCNDGRDSLNCLKFAEKNRTDKNNSPTRKKYGKNAPDSFFPVTVTASKQTKQSKNKENSRPIAGKRQNLHMKRKKSRRG